MTWAIATLDELCDINVGRTPARANSDYWGTGEPWLSIADMNQGREITTTKEQITELGAAGGRQVAPGTVLLSFKLSIGKVARAAIPLYTNEAIAALPIKRQDLITEDFLVRVLENSDLAGSSNRAAMGATLNKAKLREVRISLPSLDEQRRIAAILDKADALRAKRRQVLGHLDDLTQAIFHDMFGSPLRDLNDDDSRQLHELVDPERPITYGILKPGPDIPEGTPYVRVADMQDRGINVATVRRTTVEIAHEYRRSTLRRGDLLMSIRGHVGRMACVPDQLDGANITQDSARLAIVGASMAAYVRAAIESPTVQHWMARRTKGAAVRGINLGDLRALPLLVPSNAAISELATRVQTLERVRSSAKEQARVADEVFASLQSRAFRGDL